MEKITKMSKIRFSVRSLNGRNLPENLKIAIECTLIIYIRR
jgi:hypothetical protein